MSCRSCRLPLYLRNGCRFQSRSQGSAAPSVGLPRRRSGYGRGLALRHLSVNVVNCTHRTRADVLLCVGLCQAGHRNAYYPRHHGRICLLHPPGAGGVAARFNPLQRLRISDRNEVPDIQARVPHQGGAHRVLSTVCSARARCRQVFSARLCSVCCACASTACSKVSAI